MVNAVNIAPMPFALQLAPTRFLYLLSSLSFFLSLFLPGLPACRYFDVFAFVSCGSWARAPVWRQRSCLPACIAGCVVARIAQVQHLPFASNNCNSSNYKHCCPSQWTHSTLQRLHSDPSFFLYYKHPLWFLSVCLSVFLAFVNVYLYFFFSSIQHGNIYNLCYKIFSWLCCWSPRKHK